MTATVIGPGTLVGARTALLLADALTPEVTTAARAALAQHGYARYGLIDRGRYDFIDDAVPALCTMLQQLAAQHTQRDLQIVSARALRFGPGDYALAHHDSFHDGMPIEVIADLSEPPGAELADACVYYRRRGQAFFVMPVQPGAVSIVERGPAVTHNHGYISLRYPDAEVVRLVLLLRDRSVSSVGSVR
ncbi:MAG: hypothetical protein KBG15_09735 [Kofleriaceae bacterium]|nr:hypothetical protein [Kofleriaceae bacterium]